MVEHYSHKIQNVIQKELFKAQKSVKIAVAWFTNDLLFQPLLLKLQSGVSVELILNRDNINDSEDNEIDFNTFVEIGGILHWNESKKLMHEKFCIIDDSIVIYGSYNWTNKAEYNDESIAVSKEEYGTCMFYRNLFNKLCQTYPVESSKLVKKDVNTTNKANTNQNNVTDVVKSRYRTISDKDKERFKECRDIAFAIFENKLLSNRISIGFQGLKFLADQGDPISALFVGTCYKYGVFVEKDTTLAMKYYDISSKGGNTEAMLEMALYNSGDWLSSENVEECENLIKDASELGNPLAKWLFPRLKVN